MIGEKFGMMTILKDSGKRTKTRGMIWICQCECGTIKEISGKALARESRPRSCGCSRKLNSIQIFESNIEKTDYCWLWTSRTNRQGYGRIGSTATAHRRSYEYYKGKIPKGMCVCHICDVPLCVNPSHLFLGTHKDNSQDAVSKGRQAKGSKIRTSILTEELVLQIRKMRLSGKEYKEIADYFNVCWGTVCGICNNREWTHVDLGEECKKFPQIRKTTKGEQRHNSKIDDEKVCKIRIMLQQGIAGKEIAKLFGVHDTIISRIKNGKIWKHIP